MITMFNLLTKPDVPAKTVVYVQPRAAGSPTEEHGAPIKWK